jgi:hypothetical protein
MQREDVLELEPLGGFDETAPFQELLGLDPLLRRPDADTVAHADLEPTGPVERLDDLGQRPLHHRLADARDHGDDRDALLARRDPRDVAGRRLRTGRRRARGVRLEHLLDAQAPDLGLRTSQNLAGLGMAQLPPRAEQHQLEARLHAVALADAEGDGASLDLDHIT